MNRLLIYIAFIVLTTTISCCSSDDSTIEISSISLSKSSNELVIGESFYITTSHLPLDANSPILKYQSDNVNIATVDTTGKVTAINVGETIITVSVKNTGITKSCRIKINPILAENITLSTSDKKIAVNESFIISHTIYPENTTNKDVLWKNNNPDLISINNGKVTGLKEGIASITISTVDGSQKATCTIEVYIPVESISLDITEITRLNDGELINLTATIKPDNATYKNLIWKSDNNPVATISHPGEVDCLSEGVANITATSEYGNASATCKVTVLYHIAIDMLTISEKEHTGKIGESFQLTLKTLPDEANSEIKWKSNNTSVATVDNNGNVTLVGKGQTKIRAIAEYERISSTCVVTVVE